MNQTLSIVIISNNIIKLLLKKILDHCPPLNKIYIVNSQKIGLELLSYLNNSFLDEEFLLSFILCNNISIIY